MLGYDLKIIYKKGKQNVVADALLRKDEDVESLLYVIPILQLEWVTEARDEWKNDEEVWTLIHKLEQDPSASDTFSWKNDSLWYKDCLYLCKNSQLKQKGSFGIAHLSSSRALTIFKNLPQGQEGIFLGWP